MIKKIISGAVSAAIAASCLTFTAPAVQVGVTAASDQNYVDALDKSLFFYEVQQAGPLPEWNRVEWKTDSTMSDAVLGGWYDAGDHVKFNLPMAYSASMLAWGLYQYPNGLEKTGLMSQYANNVEFVMDYLAACDLGDEVVFQVGIGKDDHTWWGPVGLLEYGMIDNGHTVESARAILKSSKGCSAVFGEMAAALAAGYAALDGHTDDAKREGYLKHAKNIYKLAKTNPSDDYYNDSDAQGFYQSSHFYDELFYAANWLYIATGDSTYLDDAKGYIPNLSKMLGEGNTLAYGWAHCWDDTMQGGMLLYAINTGEDTYKAHVRKHLDRWVKGEEAKILPGGFRWLTDWGCLRYANTTAFLAEVASDTIFKGEDNSKYLEFAETQVNYALGDNPDNFSYLCGYGDSFPRNPHHRTAHGSWKNDLAIPATNRHILYGALVGGPTQTGAYEDDRQNYINNEVATDYNAGFTAMLCKMVDLYGGTKDPNFPAPEAHDGPEFYVEVLSKGSDSSGQTVSFKVTNHSAWPARIQDNISFRYFMDLSEVKAAGKNPEDLVIRCDRDQSKMYSGVTPAEISKPIQYSGDVYYVEVKLPDGRAVMPISEGQQQCEILLAFVMPDYGSGWDGKNDFSSKDLGKTTTGTDGSAKGVVSPYVPVYINGELYYGEEPDGTSADGLGDVKPDPSLATTTTTTRTTSSTTTTTTSGTTSTQEILSPPPSSTTTTSNSHEGGNDPSILWGDANLDNKVSVSDAVAILQSLANKDKYALTKDGARNGDVYNNGDGITANDALTIQKVDSRIYKLEDLPIKG